jgi:predicted HTH domain antitoxin
LLNVKITLEIAESAFSSLRKKPYIFAQEMRLAACVKWYELGQISQAKAAELAGLSRAEFLDALRRMGTAAVQASPSELAAEIQ